MYNISFIGAGNLAFRLSLALHQAGHRIEFILNRSHENGIKLQNVLAKSGSHAQFTDDPSKLLSSDIILLAVSDSAIAEYVDHFSKIIRERRELTLQKDGAYAPPLFLHSSGATDISVFEEFNTDNYGVFYPLMTLSKSKGIDFNIVPFILEASSEYVKQVLKELAVSLKSEYIFTSSHERLKLHTAAVFSTNFVNHMLTIAFEISGDAHNYLLPTTMESIRKCFLLSPDKVQTGPALRGDIQTMQKHLDILDELGMTQEKELYEIISKSIIERNDELQDKTE